MAMKKSVRKGIWIVAKSLVMGSLVFTRVFAAPSAPTPNHDGLVNDWRSLGSQAESGQSALPVLSGFLADMISSADLDKDLAEVVNASYEMVDQDQISALDAHWAQVLTKTENPSLVVEFLNLRSAIELVNADAQEVDDLIWLANSSKKKGCDGENNGIGNGDQDAPGGSCEGNNAENADCVDP